MAGPSVPLSRGPLGRSRFQRRSRLETKSREVLLATGGVQLPVGETVTAEQAGAFAVAAGPHQDTMRFTGLNPERPHAATRDGDRVDIGVELARGHRYGLGGGGAAEAGWRDYDRLVEEAGLAQGGEDGALG